MSNQVCSSKGTPLYLLIKREVGLCQPHLSPQPPRFWVQVLQPRTQILQKIVVLLQLCAALLQNRARYWRLETTWSCDGQIVLFSRYDSFYKFVPRNSRVKGRIPTPQKTKKAEVQVRDSVKSWKCITKNCPPSPSLSMDLQRIFSPIKLILVSATRHKSPPQYVFPIVPSASFFWYSLIIIDGTWRQLIVHLYSQNLLKAVHRINQL
jgi:hypothetical protein